MTVLVMVPPEISFSNRLLVLGGGVSVLGVHFFPMGVYARGFPDLTTASYPSIVGPQCIPVWMLTFFSLVLNIWVTLPTSPPLVSSFTSSTSAFYFVGQIFFLMNESIPEWLSSNHAFILPSLVPQVARPLVDMSFHCCFLLAIILCVYIDVQLSLN